MINLDKQKLYQHPYDYLVIDDCFDNDTFNNLLNEWPSKLIYGENASNVMGGRRQIANSASQNDTWNWLNESKTWKQFYQYINSDQMFNYFKNKFSESMEHWGCTLTDELISNEKMFSHIDWSEAGDGYVREVHADSQKRFVNFLIFFNDKNWKGGDFVIHSSDDVSRFSPPTSGYTKKYDENQAPIHEVIEAKQNRAVFFLSSPNSLHSVSKQHDTKELRKFIYGAYSSRNKKIPVFTNYDNNRLR
jgi:hypothetical protein